MTQARTPVSLVMAGYTVEVTYKSVKRITLRVSGPDKRIRVTAPLHTPRAVIERFVVSRTAWIEKRKAEIDRSVFEQSATATPDELKEYKKVVAASAPIFFERWEPIMGVKASHITYRNMKTRWGTCNTATGRITLNIRLALYPPECLEYIVVHELCHLLEKGHGPRFKQLMTHFMPDWKRRESLLR